MRQTKFCISLQVRLFDSRHYLKAFGVGDVWVAVGWSNDVIPAAKRLSNIAVIVPKSGASLWADFWVCPELSHYMCILMFCLIFFFKKNSSFESILLAFHFVHSLMLVFGLYACS